MPLIKSSSPDAFESNLKAELAADKPRDQALAIAYRVKRDAARARGGKVEAEEALPSYHELGMRVPKGGSMCANCRFLSSDTTCGNERFVRWNGGATLPAPKNQYCCDLYEHHAEHAAGGAVRGYADGGSPDDEAAMMPETYVNPAIDQMIRHTAEIPRRAIESAANYGETGDYDPGPILEAATLPMGTGAIAGLPVRAGEVALGAGPFRRLKGAAESDPDYVYHATNMERANEIAEEGLKRHKPGDFTDQDVWPDGSVERRNYFTPTARNTWQFAPEEGAPTLLRIRKDAHPFKNEKGTGDLYSTKDVPPEKIEFQHENGEWLPLKTTAGSSGVGGGPIRAYHGSPHDFDAFDMSKIGTGEGAQVYGHGLYFAEHEGTAKSYRDTLEGKGFKIPEDVSALPDEQRRAILQAANAHGAHPDAIEAAKRAQWASPELRSQPLETIADKISRSRPPAGRMYEVNINADPEHFLDWDKPFSQQSDYVRARAAEIASGFKKTPDPAGKSLYEAAAGPQKNRTEGYPNSTNALHEVGIPGIKYRDEGSRFLRDPKEIEERLEIAKDLLTKNPSPQNKAILEGSISDLSEELKKARSGITHNYVVFNDKLVNILKKYGISGAPAAAIAEEMAKGDEHSEGGAVQNAVRDAVADVRRARGGKVLTGAIKGDAPGRVDVHEAKVPDGSYVVSADVISHLGQNNSDAGLKMAEHMFGPKSNYASMAGEERHAGGKATGAGKPVDCVLAGGEYAIAPNVVRAIGRGDVDLGHKILDKWSMDVRKDHIRTLASLPPPAKD
jgi:hypothetical protein